MSTDGFKHTIARGFLEGYAETTGSEAVSEAIRQLDAGESLTFDSTEEFLAHLDAVPFADDDEIVDAEVIED